MQPFPILLFILPSSLINSIALNLIQILIAFLFIISAIAKLYPSPYFAISTFEVKQLYPLGFSETVAPWFSRILIGIELALGVLILQNNYLKKVNTLFYREFKHL